MNEIVSAKLKLSEIENDLGLCFDRQPLWCRIFGCKITCNEYIYPNCVRCGKKIHNANYEK